MPIIAKKEAKWEPVLAALALAAILLPAAAEANIAGLIGLSFLLRRRFKDLNRLPEPIKGCLRLLMSGLAILWATRILLWITACIQGETDGFALNMRLLGKQGLYGCFTIFFFCILRQMRPEKKTFPYLKALVIFYGSIAIYALLQRYFGWDFVHGWDARLGNNRFAYGVFRASGWMGHPLTLAYNALLLAVVSFSQGRYLWKDSTQRPEAQLWFGVAASAAVILYLSQSRFTLLILLGIIFFDLLFLLRKRLRILLLLGVSALIVLIFGIWPHDLGRWSELFDSRVAWEQRFDRILFWKAHWTLFLDHIWTGTGLGAYEGSLLDTYTEAGYTGLERKYNAHNIFLQTLADSGVVGGLALLSMLGALGLCAIQVKKRFDHSGLLFIFLVTVMGGLAQNNLRDSEYLFALWTSIGLVLFWLSDQGTRDESTGRKQSEDRQP